MRVRELQESERWRLPGKMRIRRLDPGFLVLCCWSKTSFSCLLAAVTVLWNNWLSFFIGRYTYFTEISLDKFSLHIMEVFFSCMIIHLMFGIFYFNLSMQCVASHSETRILFLNGNLLSPQTCIKFCHWICIQCSGSFTLLLN